MREAIRRAVKGLFPELGAGLHLDRYARVLAVADAPGQGAASSASARAMPWTSRYSADGSPIRPSDLYGGPPSRADRGGAGERLFQLPEPGAQVVVGFAYGRPDHPIIRQTYPRRVPSGGGAGRTASGEHPAVYQRADAGGNWTRATEAKIEMPAGSAWSGPDVRGRTRHGNADHLGALKEAWAASTDRGHNLVACGRAAGGSRFARQHQHDRWRAFDHHHGQGPRTPRAATSPRTWAGTARRRLQVPNAGDSGRREPEDRRRRNHNRLRGEHGDGRRREKQSRRRK